MDAFCYTPKEFDTMFIEGIVLILDAIDEGICLLGQDFYKNYKRKIESLKKKGLRKDPPVWILPDSMLID